MKEFFHGWRRKAGVVTLVMSLAILRDAIAADVRFEEWVSHLKTTPTAPPIDDVTVDGRTVRVTFKTPDGEVVTEDIRDRFSYSYHLAFVIPLTLLSAYLILWKPRKRATT